MKSSRKKLMGVVILFSVLVPFGVAVKKVYRELRQPELNSALIAAIKRNDTVLVMALLGQGADANARDLPPDTRSQWGRLWDYLRRKPPPRVEGTSALFVAMPWLDEGRVPVENVPLIRALLKAGADINVVDKHENDSILSWAILTSRRETATLLLERGARVDIARRFGASALHLAVAKEHDSDLVQMLLERSALVNAKNDDGSTPLHWAARNSQAHNMRLLIAYGSDINALNAIGESPLVEAICYGNADCVKLLLARGALVNTKDSGGDTPLACAAGRNNAEYVRLLLARGAQVNSQDIRGLTPLKEARQRHNSAIIKMLKKAGARE